MSKCMHEIIYPTDGSKPQCKICGKVAGEMRGNEMNDIQLGKDQIENYQNGDIDRPFNKEKEAFDNHISEIKDYSRIRNVNEISNDAFHFYGGYHSRDLEISQLKAMNEKLKHKNNELGCMLNNACDKLFIQH